MDDHRRKWMRNGCLAAVALAFIAPTASLAQSPLPDLQGVWTKTEGSIIYWNSEINDFDAHYDIAQIEITEQHGEVFKAFQTTIAKGEAQPGFHGDTAITTPRLPMLGVIGWDGQGVTLADIDDTTVHRCVLADADTMRCTVYEAGERALAGRFVMKRQEQ